MSAKSVLAIGEVSNLYSPLHEISKNAEIITMVSLCMIFLNLTLAGLSGLEPEL